MPKKERLNTFVLALLIYLPTCAFVPDYTYLLVLAYAVADNYSFIIAYFKGLFSFKFVDRNFTYLIVFSFIAFLVRLTDYADWTSVKSLYSFAYFFPFTYLVARSVSIRPKVYKIVVYFVLIESFFGVIEYLMGVNTFFTSLTYFREFESYELLYYTRVFGLSPNSSGFSIKLVVAIVLLSHVKFKTRTKLVIESILLTASVIAFGRIAIIAIVLYYLLVIFDSLIVRKVIPKMHIIPFVAFILFFAINPIWTKNQFTRNNMKVSEQVMGTEEEGYLTEEEAESIEFELTEKLGIGKINMAGRNQIWNTFVKFGIKNIVLGNKSEKFMIGKIHAHNSYIEIFASFGLFMSILLMFIFVKSITMQNYVVILSFMILAFGQYFIFWGISFFDIIFYSILFFNKSSFLNETERSS